MMMRINPHQPGLDTVNAEAAGRIRPGLFFAETNGNADGTIRRSKWSNEMGSDKKTDLSL
jgi:hypothetical protein